MYGPHAKEKHVGKLNISGNGISEKTQISN